MHFEMEANFSNKSNVTALKKEVDYLYSISDLAAVRALFSFDGCTKKQVHILVKIAKLANIAENARLCILGTPRWLREYEIDKILPKNWYTFVRIENKEDIELLMQMKRFPMEAMVFWVTPENYKDLFEGYFQLQREKFTVNDFCNFKIRDDFWNDLSKDQIQDFKVFFTEVTKDNYFYDKEVGQVYNIEPYLPIKGIRPVKKFLYKFIGDADWWSVIVDDNGNIYRHNFEDIKITHEQLTKNLKELHGGDGVDYGHSQRYWCEKCTGCIAEGQCWVPGNEKLSPPNRLCAGAKFSILVLGCVPSEVSKEKKARFSGHKMA